MPNISAHIFFSILSTVSFPSANPHIICYAADVIRNGDESIMVASGTDENTDVTEYLYGKLGLVHGKLREGLGEGKLTISVMGPSAVPIIIPISPLLSSVTVIFASESALMPLMS